MIKLYDYSGNSQYDKVVLLSFNSASSSTSITGTVIHFSNYVTDPAYAAFTSSGNFIMSG